jgi:hypothetical protein
MTLDTRGTDITEFGIRPRGPEALLLRGQQAARTFLQRWERDHAATPA